MSIIRIRDKNGNIIDIPAIKGNDYILTEVDKENIANKTADLIQQAECIPLGSAENRLNQLLTKTITEVTAEDLEGTTKIYDYAFYYCYKLTSVTIPDRVTSIGQQAFMYCDSLPSIAIPDSVTGIDRQAFMYCKALNSVTISNRVKTLSNALFRECTNLTSVTIPDSVTRIDDYVFYYCSSLTNLTIPDSVTHIGSSALTVGSTSNKATITFLRIAPPSIYTKTFKTDCLEKIIVPKGCGEAYKTATNWANFADYIEEASV